MSSDHTIVSGHLTVIEPRPETVGAFLHSPDSSSPPAGLKGDPAAATDLPRTRWEVTGMVMTVVSILLVLFLLYLYAFSALTGARNQSRLLHSLNGNPRARFSLATGHRPSEGRPVGILEIPTLQLHEAVVEGTSAADLQLGPGLDSSSRLPGDPGNAVIAGRRVSFGGPFRHISSLKRGDKIQVVDGAGSFTFRVVSAKDIGATTESIATYGPSWLTLVSSDSSWIPGGRTVVVARLIGSPASTTRAVSTKSLLPSLGGDPAAVFLAGAWVLAFGAVMYLMLLGIRRWRQPWSSYLLAMPVLLACGLFACENLARCLPATL